MIIYITEYLDLDSYNHFEIILARIGHVLHNLI
jgi:hypothetical protein